MRKGSVLIKNINAVVDGTIAKSVDILVIDGKIYKIGKHIKAYNVDTFDGNGCCLLPGFVDMHVHGGGGADFMDGTVTAFETAVKAHLKHGTTTLAPTALTASKEELLRFVNAYLAFKTDSEYADIACGIHLEGPYFSSSNSKSKGAQSVGYIRPVDISEIEEMLLLAGKNLIRWDAAPEIENSAEFARIMRGRGVICGVAHTNATAEEAQQGFKNGFSHITHFYNATTAYMKRDQVVTAGVVEAAYLDDDVTVELICDGRHIPKACLQLALKIKGADKVAGITDATRISGSDLKDGKLGSNENGTYIIVDDEVAKLPDLSSYAGSICTMDKALKVLCVDYDVDLITASKMLSSTPARLMNIDDVVGSIELGKNADLVLIDDKFNILKVFKNGIA